MRLIIFFCLFIAFKAISSQNLSIELIEKKIDSLLFKNNFSVLKNTVEKKCYDFNFFNYNFKNKGLRKYTIYTSNNNIKKIVANNVKVNNVLLDISLYPFSINKDFEIFIIQIYNTKTKTTKTNKGFIILNKKNLKLFHLSYSNPYVNGIGKNNYIEGISLLDENLNSVKYINFKLNTLEVKSKGCISHDSINFITFTPIKDSKNVVFDKNCYNLTKLFEFEQKVSVIKHYSKSTKLPYFQPYLIYGYSLLDYDKFD